MNTSPSSLFWVHDDEHQFMKVGHLLATTTKQLTVLCSLMFPDLKQVIVKAEEFVTTLQQIHSTTKQQLEDANAKYKQVADVKRRHVEFEVGDFVWAILTKECFPTSDYNKLAEGQIGPVEIMAKINPNAYLLKLPSHIRTVDVFNVKLLFPYHGDSYDEEELNSGTNSSQPMEDDATGIAHSFLF
ncbi:hypothetical protein L3X38_017194 [Prunus dulcis]|uniref:Tf2-1-like SH3-like domain-containing protein n=1 Tax=Prunus dulcis TaxID=3755 RepID=A0AAD4W6V0_PRUDU|nr:hypothetical protein L3X38_017194 [Prunus dulcis]